MGTQAVLPRGGKRAAGIQIIGDMPNDVRGFKLGIIDGEIELHTLFLPYGERPYGPIIDHLKCADEVALLIGASDSYFGYTFSKSTAAIGARVAMISPGAFHYYREEVRTEERTDVPHLLAKLLLWDRQANGLQSSIFNWFETPQHS